MHLTYGSSTWYRGPKAIPLLDESGSDTGAIAQIGAARYPLFIISRSGSAYTVEQTLDISDPVAHPHHGYLYVNRTSAAITMQPSTVGNLSIPAGGIGFQPFPPAPETGTPNIGVTGTSFINGENSTIYSGVWELLKPRGTAREFNSLEFKGFTNGNGTSHVSTDGTGGTRAVIGATITPHSAGTLEQPGIPLSSANFPPAPYNHHSSTTPLLPIQSEQWHKLVLKVGPDAGAVSNGITLKLGTGEEGENDPQTGFTLQTTGTGGFAPLTLPADGKIEMLPSSELYQKLTSLEGLTLFLKRDSTVNEFHRLGLDLIPKRSTYLIERIAALDLPPVEVISDLNNDGQISPADNPLRDAAMAGGATDEIKDKGTEFIFHNDQLSNGKWDKEEPTTLGKPADADDDDAEPIQVNISSLSDQTQVWLDHPASAGLKYYRDRKCTQEIPLSSSHRHVIGGPVAWPTDNKLFMRADVDSALPYPPANPQFEGDLVLKIKIGTNGQEIESARIKLTVVKEFGAKKYFHATKDYIFENNTPFFLHSKHYNTTRKVLITAMREQDTIMRALDTYHHTPKLYGIDQVTAQYPNATVIINGNMTFDLQGIGGGLEMSRRCHGRLVSGSALNTNTSSDNENDENPPPNFLGIGHPLRGDELAGPLGKYIAMVADGDFTFAKGRVSLDPIPAEALGGLSTNYAIQNPDQFVGLAKLTDEESILFTVTCAVTTSGVSKQIAADAKQSGVEALPGGEAHELKLFKFDGGTSLALSHGKPNGALVTPIKGSKHTGRLLNDYCIHTYLMFKSERPCNDE